MRSSRNAYLLNGLLDERRTKSRDCKTPGGSPHFWSGTVNLKGTASANSFAACLLLFSEKQTLRRTVNATHPLCFGAAQAPAGNRLREIQPSPSSINADRLKAAGGAPSTRPCRRRTSKCTCTREKEEGLVPCDTLCITGPSDEQPAGRSIAARIGGSLTNATTIR